MNLFKSLVGRVKSLFTKAAATVAAQVATPAPAPASVNQISPVPPVVLINPTQVFSSTQQGGTVSTSQITDADLAIFKSLYVNTPSKAEWFFVIGKNHVGKDGKPLHVNTDMVNFPATYGFKDAEAVKGYFATIETAPK